MAKKPQSEVADQLEPLLQGLRGRPNSGNEMLDLAIALDNRGHREAAAQVELAALALRDPAVTHRWRQMQTRRAPANQFLLLSNEVRTHAFRQALSDRVSPGNLVLEIGTGSGILAMLAAHAGAGQVISCERQPVMADVATAIVEDNGLGGVISVLPKHAHELQLGCDLPGPADVLVGDLFTGSLLEAGGLKLFHQARSSFVKEEGRVVPAKATLRGRLVAGSDLERLCRAGSPAGLDLTRFNLFSPPVIQILPERFEKLDYQALSEVIDCFDFDFETLEGFKPRQKSSTIRTTGAGDCMGFLQWLRLELSPGNHLESSESSKVAWSRYLHVFPNPIRVEAGQHLQLQLAHDWTSFSVWPIS